MTKSARCTLNHLLPLTLTINLYILLTYGKQSIIPNAKMKGENLPTYLNNFKDTNKENLENNH